MKVVFDSERIRISDIVHPVTKLIVQKTFNNCELFGPANLILNGITANGVAFNDCEFIVLRENVRINNAVVLDKCHIIGSQIWNVTVFLSQEFFDDLKSSMPNIESLSYAKP